MRPDQNIIYFGIYFFQLTASRWKNRIINNNNIVLNNGVRVKKATYDINYPDLMDLAQKLSASNQALVCAMTGLWDPKTIVNSVLIEELILIQRVNHVLL